MIDLKAIKVGDRITFKSPTRSHCRKATRVVRVAPFERDYYASSPRVRYNGWDDFVVMPFEILEHHPAAGA